LHNELIKSEALAAGLGDSGAGSLGEAESSDVDLWHIEDSLIIGDSGDDNDGSISLGSEVLDDLGEGERRTVGSGGDESSEDGLGEGGVGSAGQESEQLHTKRAW